jgi:spermidine synthase
MTPAKASVPSTGKKKRRTDPATPPAPSPVRNKDAGLFAGMLLFSGTAALVYQVLWIKQLSLVVGVEVYSISIAVSAFFAGLALGSFIFGRRADGMARPLLLYAILEGGVAIAGIATTYLLAHAAGPFALLEAHIGALAWLIPFLLVGVPAFLMGGTLPVAVRSYGTQGGWIADTGGRLYALNTAGGIAGALLSTFVFLPQFGVRGTAYTAAVCNLVSIAIAIVMNRSAADKTDTEAASTSRLSRDARLALGLYALAGGIALGYEVVWSQAIVQFMSTRSFAFSIVLATYLAGLVLGSALYARYADRVGNPWSVFGFLIAAAGLIALVEIAGLRAWQLQVQALFGDLAYAATRSLLVRMCARFLIAAVGVVFVPTVLLGAAFPAALRLIAGRDQIGRDVGAVVALNTAGGIAGTLLTGFYLVPTLGLVRSLGVLAIVAAAIGVFAVFRNARAHQSARWAVLAIGMAAVAGGVMTPHDQLARLLTLTHGAGEVVFYEESKGGTVAVVQEAKTPVFRRLYIQGVSNSGDSMPSLRYMRLQALLPLLIHTGEPHSALVVGLGTGITAGALTQYPLNRRVCAELLPAVVRASTMFQGNFEAASNARLEIHIRDGRRELMENAARYDVITLEPPPPSAAGVVNLYSRNFYRLAASRLEPNGLFAQWLPIAAQNDEDTRSLVKSFLDVFPYATMWTTELHEMLLIGSLDPITLDVGRITERFNRSDVAEAMGEVGIPSAEALIATWVTGREGLERYAGDALPVTDDRPRIEYAGWVRPDEITRVLPKMLSYRTDPPLIGADDSFKSAVANERDGLTAFYAAGVAAYAGDRDTWKRNIEIVLRVDGENPYYRWVMGAGR